MMNKDVQERLIEVLMELLGITIIKDRQGGAKPEGLYGMLELANWSNLHEHEVRIDYAGPEDAVLATPRMELEWVFLFFIYGEGGEEKMRRLQSAVKLENNILTKLKPQLTIHSISTINRIPELIGQVWEPRTQTNVIVRGVADEAFEVDVITKHTIDIERK